MRVPALLGLVACSLRATAHARDDGLARTPPMVRAAVARSHQKPRCAADGRIWSSPHSGDPPRLTAADQQGWSTWYAFGADINETKIVEMADAIVERGLRDAGYEFVS